MEDDGLNSGGENSNFKLRSEEMFQNNKASLLIAFLGLIFVLAGVFVVIRAGQKEDKIEIIPAKEETSQKIKADIEGAVIHPGVYELDVGSRVNDLLITAGGLSAEADRSWVEKSLNKAQKLADGIKIYIPNQGETAREKEDGTVASDQKTEAQKTDKININTASAAELDILWGVGPVTAQKIIDNRPYQDISDLINKKIVTKNVYERITEQISVY